MNPFQHYQRVVDESGNFGQWAHVSLDQVRDLFPKVPLSAFCEAPCHIGHRHPAAVFHAVFWTERVEAWVSCWQCYQDMLGPDTAMTGT